MFRQHYPHIPTASVPYPTVPAFHTRHLSRSVPHSSPCDSALILAPATSHASPTTNSFRIRTSENHAPNPFRIRTYKTQDLKSFRIRTYKKTGVGGTPGRVQTGGMVDRIDRGDS